MELISFSGRKPFLCLSLRLSLVPGVLSRVAMWRVASNSPPEKGQVWTARVAWGRSRWVVAKSS